MLRPHNIVEVTTSQGALVFGAGVGVNSIEIEQGFETLTDTARIKLPNRIRLKGQEKYVGDTGVINRGDTVSVNMGYYPEGFEEFRGYVAYIQNNEPFTLRCEDAAFLLKRNTLNLSYEQVSVEQLASDVVAGTGLSVNTIDAQLGQLRISNATPAEILDEVKRVYGLNAYIFQGELVIGLTDPPGYQPRTHVFKFEGGNVISNRLEYVTEDNVRIKVRAVSIYPDNTKLEIEVGDSAGELRTLTFYNLEEAELRARAEALIGELKYSGYRGSFQTFGKPSVSHGDYAELISDRLPERAGVYKITKVIKRFSTSAGYTQDVHLGAKLR